MNRTISALCLFLLAIHANCPDSSQSPEIGAVSPTKFFDGDLIQASDGNLWGTFFAVPGIVFSTTPSGSFS